MKWILFFFAIVVTVISLTGCGDSMVYKDACPLNNQPATVQDFFNAPVQCIRNGQHLQCVRFQ